MNGTKWNPGRDPGRAGSGIGSGPAAQKPSRRRRGGLGVLGRVLGFVLFFALVFFGGSWLISPEPDVSPSGPPAVAALEGRDVAVIGYSRDGPRGMFQLMFQPMFQTRLCAIDVATGERVWDVRLDDELSNETRVLAAENGLVYVATEDGLLIRSLEDGSAVAEPDTIEGLGERYLAALDAYDVDLERGLVLAIDGSGEVRQIPFGSSVAESADAEVEALWRPVLAASSGSRPTTGRQARIDADTVITARPARPGAIDERLILVSGAQETALGDAVFMEPRVVLDGVPGAPRPVEAVPEQEGLDEELDELRREQARAAAQLPETNRETDAAVGRDAGYAMLLSLVDANEHDYRIDTVDLETGAVMGGIDGIGSSVSGARTREGATALAVKTSDYRAAVLVVADRDGRVASFGIGASNFFGRPR